MKIPKRLFAMSFDKLLKKSRTMLRIGTRDAERLNQYGVTPAFLEDYSGQLDAFQKMNRDKDFREKTIDLTTERKRVRRAVIAELRYFGMAFKKSFGKDSVFYLNMEIRRLGGLNDDKVLGIAAMTVEKAQNKLAELSAEGITTERITAFASIKEEFVAALNAIEAAEDARAEATRQRIAAANNLYRAGMKICRAGWREFADDPAVRKSYRMK